MSGGMMHAWVQSAVTFTGRKQVAPDYPYAPFNEDGTKNTRWKNLVEMLTELIGDESRPADEHGRAAEILEYYAGYVKHETEDGTSVWVAESLGESAVGLMWFNPDDVWFQTATAKDGSTYQVVVSKKYHGPKHTLTNLHQFLRK